MCINNESFCIAKKRKSWPLYSRNYFLKTLRIYNFHADVYFFLSGKGREKLAEALYFLYKNLENLYKRF